MTIPRQRMLPLDPPHTPRSNRRYERKAPPALEVRTHIAIADVLRWAKPERRGWQWTHLPMGERRDPATAGKLERMGVKPGWPDFIFIGATGVYFLELKRGGESLSDHQQSFFDSMKARHNIECRMADSYEQAIRILAGWGVVPITTSLREASI